MVCAYHIVAVLVPLLSSLEAVQFKTVNYNLAGYTIRQLQKTEASGEAPGSSTGLAEGSERFLHRLTANLKNEDGASHPQAQLQEEASKPTPSAYLKGPNSPASRATANLTAKEVKPPVPPQNYQNDLQFPKK